MTYIYLYSLIIIVFIAGFERDGFIKKLYNIVDYKYLLYICNCIIDFLISLFFVSLDM